MAKGIWVGVEGTPRKVRKTYVGVGGVVKPVRKAWVGVSGTPRIIYSAGISKITSVTSLDNTGSGNPYDSTTWLSATYNTAYAIYQTVNTATLVTEAYNSSLVKSVVSGLLVYRGQTAGAGVGGYAIFAGGIYGSTYFDDTDAINTSLVKITPASDIGTARYQMGATSTPTLAVFVGGKQSSSVSAEVIGYNSSLVKVIAPSPLDIGVNLPGCGCVGQYAVVYGGKDSGGEEPTSVTVYDSSLVRVRNLYGQENMHNIHGAGNDSYLVFADTYNIPYTPIAISSNLVVTPLTRTYAAYSNIGVASTSEFAIFAGGHGDGGTLRSEVFTYNKTLTLEFLEEGLGVARSGMVSSKIGNKVLFGGGRSSVSSFTNVVDAYEF